MSAQGRMLVQLVLEIHFDTLVSKIYRAPRYEGYAYRNSLSTALLPPFSALSPLNGSCGLVNSRHCANNFKQRYS
jgi:hypothetical protein